MALTEPVLYTTLHLLYAGWSSNAYQPNLTSPYASQFAPTAELGQPLSWWTPTRTTTNWPPIILGLPSLFLEMSVCRLIYHGIFILICPNMLCAKSVDSACVRMLCKMRQQRGLKVVLAYVTNVLVKMNMFRTRCMHFCFAKTIKFVSCSWGNTFPSCLHLFLRTS